MAEIDGIDEHILRILSQDGRISNLKLADRVGLSPSACLRRVQELERRDIISGYRAILNRKALGDGFVAYVAVGLSDHSKLCQENFERHLERAPQVKECHNVTGTFEYLLRIETADLPSYKIFHTDILGTLPHVTSIQTYVVIDSPKDERA